jgi:hypothetical protein
MEDSTLKSLTEPRKLVMTETIMTTMDVQAPANLNAVMVSSLVLKNAILVPTMPTLPINVRPTAELPDVVMDLRIIMRNAIMLHLDNLLPLAETTVSSLTVEMESLTLSMAKSVMLDLQETLILPQLDVLLDVPSTPAVPSDPQQLVISTEPWLAQVVSMPMLVLLLDLHAVDLFNGWLLNLSKRSRNSKLTNSKMFLELE